MLEGGHVDEIHVMVSLVEEDGTMRQLIIVMLLVGLTMAACTKDTPLPPPAQGPAALADPSFPARPSP